MKTRVIFSFLDITFDTRKNDVSEPVEIEMNDLTIIPRYMDDIILDMYEHFDSMTAKHLTDQIDKKGGHCCVYDVLHKINEIEHLIVITLVTDETMSNMKKFDVSFNNIN
jgi:hypothetical protein